MNIPKRNAIIAKYVGRQNLDEVPEYHKSWDALIAACLIVADDVKYKVDTGYIRKCIVQNRKIKDEIEINRNIQAISFTGQHLPMAHLTEDGRMELHNNVYKMVACLDELEVVKEEPEDI